MSSQHRTLRTLITLSMWLASGGLAVGGITAQSMITHIVSLSPAAFPLRLAFLQKIRHAALSGSTADYADAVRDLELAHGAAWAAARAQALALGGVVEHEYSILGGAAVRLSTVAATALQAHSDVEAVTPDTLIGATIANQTASFNHNANATTLAGHSGLGVTLALLDSGIDIELSPGSGVAHPAFLDASGTASRIIKAVGIADALDAEDTTGHGTAVAGIALARQWGLSPAADDGFARDAKLASYKITIAGSPGSTTNNAWVSDWIAAGHAVVGDRRALSIVAAVASYSGSPDPSTPQQRVVDCVAHYADVLVTSSAGNDGGLFDAAARSQSNANGIAVASVLSSSHQCAADSSEGPLPGDPRRAWPDIAAVGVGVFAPAIDNGIGTSLPISGTSFAAPCAAGTALVLRAADPSLDAIATKALMLAAAARLDLANPDLDRRFFGVGLLRTDRAIDALLSGTRWTRGAPPTGQFTSHSFVATAGQPIVATLAWHRVDDRSLDWNQLDLQVRDPSGRVLARSQQPRNLDETLHFVPQLSGPHQLEVVGVDVSNPGAPYALVLADAPAARPQAGKFSVRGSGCSGSGRDNAALVLPSWAAATEGNARTPAPFASSPSKVQQALDGASIPSGTIIEGLAFRRDETHAGDPSFEVDIEVLLGHTSTAPTTLSAQFALNPASPMTVVYRSTAHRIPASSNQPLDLDQFDIVLPLDAPFVTATSPSQHLLLEIRVFGHSRGSIPFGMNIDAALDFGGPVRVRGAPADSVGVLEPISTAVSILSASGPPLTPLPPRIDGGGNLQIGGSYDVVLSDARPLAAVGLLFRNVESTPVSTLFDLAPIGAPGCLLDLPAAITLPNSTDAFGQSLQSFVIAPSATNLIGTAFDHQWIVLDPPANTLGITVTGSGRARLGG